MMTMTNLGNGLQHCPEPRVARRQEAVELAIRLVLTLPPEHSEETALGLAADSP